MNCAKSSLYYLYGYLERHKTLPRDLVVNVFGYEARGQGSIPVCRTYFQCVFLSCFNILMPNASYTSKMASLKRPKWSFRIFLYCITLETYGDGVKFGPFERELVW